MARRGDADGNIALLWGGPLTFRQSLAPLETAM
jgi:hypothetical protein